MLVTTPWVHLKLLYNASVRTKISKSIFMLLTGAGLWNLGWSSKVCQSHLLMKQPGTTDRLSRWCGLNSTNSLPYHIPFMTGIMISGPSKIQILQWIWSMNSTNKWLALECCPQDMAEVNIPVFTSQSAFNKSLPSELLAATSKLY